MLFVALWKQTDDTFLPWQEQRVQWTKLSNGRSLGHWVWDLSLGSFIHWWWMAWFNWGWNKQPQQQSISDRTYNIYKKQTTISAGEGLSSFFCECKQHLQHHDVFHQDQQQGNPVVLLKCCRRWSSWYDWKANMGKLFAWLSSWGHIWCTVCRVEFPCGRHHLWRWRMGKDRTKNHRGAQSSSCAVSQGRSRNLEMFDHHDGKQWIIAGKQIVEPSITPASLKFHTTLEPFTLTFSRRMSCTCCSAIRFACEQNTLPVRPSSFSFDPAWE